MNNNTTQDLVSQENLILTSILENYGTINEVKDGVVLVKEGLNKVGMSEMVEFEKTGLKGIVNYLGREKSITVLGNIRNLKVGDLVKRLNILPYIEVNTNILGRVVDPLGMPIDGLGEIKNRVGGRRLNIEKKAPGIIERESVKDALETGVKFLDSMIGRPLGYYLYCNKINKKRKFEKVNKRLYGNVIKKDNKWSQFKFSYKELNLKLNEYTLVSLKKYKDSSTIFGLAGFISLFLGPKISFLGVYIYLLATFEFIIALVLLFYVMFKQLQFIYNYNLDCNPKIIVKSVLVTTKLFGPYFSVVLKTTGIGFGGLLSTNWFIENTRGVNILEEYGRNYIDGDKSFLETKDIITEKIKKGYKELD